MAQLDVTATIHPTSPQYVLVSVQTTDGKPVYGLRADNFELFMWAGKAWSPGSSVLHLPILSVRELPVRETGYFYEIVLDSLGVGSGASPYESGSLEALGGAVYTVTVNTRIDHGQAIALTAQLSDKS